MTTFPVTHQDLMQPVMAALHAHGGALSKQTILEDVIRRLELPETVVNRLHGNRSGQTELGYRLSWALTYLRTEKETASYDLGIVIYD